HDALLEFSSSKPQDHCSTEVPKGSRNINPTASASNPLADHMETLTVKSPIPTVSSPVPTSYSTDSQEPSSDARLISKRVTNQEETPSLDNILSLTNRFEDILGVKRIFRYLKGYPKLGLWYPKELPFDLVSFSDSDYGGVTQDRKSTTGGCQFLGRRLISWQCKKQTIVATSTIEAEYVAAASCCGQVPWIQNQLLDYGYNFMNTKIYIDNNSAIYLLTKPFDAGRFQYLVCKLFPLLGKLSTASVFLGFGLASTGTSKYWGVLRILMIGLKLIPLGEHNTDFHHMVDFIKESPLRYALTVKPTVYVSHLWQFWSTARIETMEEGTKILATVDGIVRTVSESSLRRNLK
nr:putative ribonuclease H-like domain-containing protein [Tanacetum cinerariifolium]